MNDPWLFAARCFFGSMLVICILTMLTARYRRIIREQRRLNRWPSHGHTDRFFCDMKRGHFPEDLR